MVSFPEALVAHRTPQFVHVPALFGVGRGAARDPHAAQATHGARHAADAATPVALVVRPHVIHQVRSHAEADVALGAHVLRGQRERRGRNGRGQ